MKIGKPIEFNQIKLPVYSSVREITGELISDPIWVMLNDLTTIPIHSIMGSLTILIELTTWRKMIGIIRTL